jgi:hypothetical protein
MAVMVAGMVVLLVPPVFVAAAAVPVVVIVAWVVLVMVPARVFPGVHPRTPPGPDR